MNTDKAKAYRKKFGTQIAREYGRSEIAKKVKAARAFLASGKPATVAQAANQLQNLKKITGYILDELIRQIKDKGE